MDSTHISDIKYPDFGDIASYQINKVVPIEKKLFGVKIYWEVKEDGENTGVYLDENGELQLRTRNVIKLSEDLRQRFLQLPCADNIRELLEKAQTFGGVENGDAVLFGEFCVKGKSPKRVEIRDENRFVAFDLWCPSLYDNPAKPPFTEPHLLKIFCSYYDVPMVKILDETISNSLEELLEVRDNLLEKVRINRWEGVVGKAFVSNEFGTFVNLVKEKIDVPKIKIQKGSGEVLPMLSDSEIEGAIEKVLFEIGVESFKDSKITMPLVAEKIKEQCVKHKCQKPGQRGYTLYRERLIRLG